MKPTLVAALALVLGAACLTASAPVYSNDFVAVTLDGVRLGTDLDPSNYSLFPSVVYDPSTEIFHMWVFPASTLSVEGLRHATSMDGVHFVSTGNLTFAGGNPFPAYGAPVEPEFAFPRAARQGNDWKLLLWTENNPSGTYGDYNYNESVNDIGADPGTLAVTHQGPIYPTNGLGTYGQTTGPFGLVNGAIYTQYDIPGGLGKWTFDDATPPNVDTPYLTAQDLITGTGYVYFLTHPGDPLGVYVHNVGRVLVQGDGTLGVYYSLRHPDGTRVNKQVYYSQSGDGGETWSSPVGLFSNGDAVRVDHAPNQFFFSHPEVTLVGVRRVLYFSTKAADGAFVLATSAAQPPQPGSWADILGGGGESGTAVTRTADGGYAVAGTSSALTSDPYGTWLLKLDATGEVLRQAVYSRSIPGPGEASAIVEAGDGGLVMAGTVGLNPTSIWILKVDILGNVVWSETISTTDPIGGSNNKVSGLVRTSDDGFALAGKIAGHFGLTKLGPDGSLQWIRAYPASETPDETLNFASALAETPDGGLAAVGSSGISNACRVLKVGSTGEIEWEETISDYSACFAAGIANGPSGDLVVTGGSLGFSGVAPWVAAFGAAGSMTWQKKYSFPHLVRAIARGAGGGYGIVADNLAGSGAGVNVAGAGSRGILCEIDASGAPAWAKSFAAQLSSGSEFQHVVSTFDGGFLAVGQDHVAGDTRLLAVKVDAGGAFVGCLDEEVTVPFTATDASFTPVAIADTPVDELANTVVAAANVTSTPTDAPERIICRATLPTELGPTALQADPFGNGVADPGEEFTTAPSWANYGLLARFLSGHASAVSDTNGLDTTDPDLDADYGTVASLATSNCLTDTGDCYLFRFQNAPRPYQHWDTYFDETLSTSDPHHRWAKRWTVHAGLSFDDVSPSSGYYPFIENVFHNGITAGCGAAVYCPGNPVTRAQMSVFLLKSMHGASFVPPACTAVFADVPCPSQYADWIEELHAEGITAGCGAGNYCPDDAVTRQQMSAFLLKSLNGSGYVPPGCNGIFGDVACPSLFANWIEDLYNRGITAGCSASPLLYCPDAPNTREQMAVFLVKTFSLLLYGP